MTRLQRRKHKWRTARARIALTKATDKWYSYRPDLLEELILGKYSNNNYVNKGGFIKTNVRKRHSNYRRAGGFGEDMRYCPHDKRQVEDMNLQMKEYKNGF